MVEILQLANKISSFSEVLFKKGDLKKLQGNFAGKKSVLESLFNKIGVRRIYTFIEEDSDTGVFLLNLQTF